MLVFQLGVIIFFILILIVVCHDEYRKKKLGRKSVKLDKFWRDEEDRRKKIRISTEIGVLYEVLTGKKSARCNSVSRNISLGGVNLVLTEKLSPGIELNLQLDVPGQRKVVVACGRVVWVKEVSQQPDEQNKQQRAFATGVRFTSMTSKDEDGLRKFIAQHVKDAARKTKINFL